MKFFSFTRRARCGFLVLLLIFPFTRLSSVVRKKKWLLKKRPISEAFACHNPSSGTGSFRSKNYKRKWNEDAIVTYLNSHPQRANFASLFRDGGFHTGLEVGVADGRFSEHFLRSNENILFAWHMVEPFPNAQLKERFSISDSGTANFRKGSWAKNGVGISAFKYFTKQLSLSPHLVRDLQEDFFDFIYLDGAHDYFTVKQELQRYFSKVTSGGLLAGHDYCNYGEKGLDCIGCKEIPQCQEYTEFGAANGKGTGIAANQNEVVRAVQEWIVENHPSMRIHYTLENFTKDTLIEDGFDYDLVITNTRNPSWYVVKP